MPAEDVSDPIDVTTDPAPAAAEGGAVFGLLLGANLGGDTVREGGATFGLLLGATLGGQSEPGGGATFGLLLGATLGGEAPLVAGTPNFHAHISGYDITQSGHYVLPGLVAPQSTLEVPGAIHNHVPGATGELMVTDFFVDEAENCLVSIPGGQDVVGTYAIDEAKPFVVDVTPDDNGPFSFRLNFVSNAGFHQLTFVGMAGVVTAVFPPANKVEQGTIYGPNGDDFIGTAEFGTGGGGNNAAILALLTADVAVDRTVTPHEVVWTNKDTGVEIMRKKAYDRRGNPVINSLQPLGSLVETP